MSFYRFRYLAALVLAIHAMPGFTYAQEPALKQEAAPAKEAEPTKQESPAPVAPVQPLPARETAATPLPQSCEDQLKALSVDRENILAQIKNAYQQRNEALQEKDGLLKQLKETEEKLNALKAAPVEPAAAVPAAAPSEPSPAASVSPETEKARADELEKLRRDLASAEAVATKAISENVSLKLEQLSRTQGNKDAESQLILYKAQAESLEREKQALIHEKEELTAKIHSYEEEIKKLSKARPESGPPDQLAQALKQKEQLIRDNASMHYNMGVLFVENKKYDLAVKEFEKAIEVRPDDADSYYNLGSIYADYLNDQKKAIEYLHRYLELRPDAKPQEKNWIKSVLATFGALQGKEARFKEG